MYAAGVPNWSILETMEVPGLTEARVLTAFGTEASLRAALRKLAEPASWHERRHETYFLIRTLASWAVTLAAAGDTAAALAMQCPGPG